MSEWVRWRVLGWIWLTLGVARGAVGAHALRSVLTEQMLATFETGVRYQLVMGLCIVQAAQAAPGSGASSLRGVRLLGVGSFIFSGSLYVLVLTGNRLWGAVTPVGGVLMLLGLLTQAWRCYREGGDPS